MSFDVKDRRETRSFFRRAYANYFWFFFFFLEIEPRVCPLNSVRLLIRYDLRYFNLIIEIKTDSFSKPIFTYIYIFKYSNSRYNEWFKSNTTIDQDIIIHYRKLLYIVGGQIADFPLKLGPIDTNIFLAHKYLIDFHSDDERESCHNHTLVCDSLGPVSLLCSVTDDLWAPCQFAKIINRPWLISFPPTFDSGEFLSSFFFFSSSTFLIRRAKLHGERISHSGQCESNFNFADLCVLR